MSKFTENEKIYFWYGDKIHQGFIYWVYDFGDTGCMYDVYHYDEWGDKCIWHGAYLTDFVVAKTYEELEERSKIKK